MTFKEKFTEIKLLLDEEVVHAEKNKARCDAIAYTLARANKFAKEMKKEEAEQECDKAIFLLKLPK